MALFGSYARNEQTDNSDIDIMVLKEGGTFRDFSNLYEQLKQYFPEQKVQLVSKKAIKPQYFERLKEDLLYV
jgi:predicted nucleotidyltransferase